MSPISQISVKDIIRETYKPEIHLTDKDIELINGFKEAILKHPENYVLMDEIFFEKMGELSFDDKLNDIEVIGGVGKKLAILKIIAEFKISLIDILYIGDSITDMQSLKYARLIGGVSISFNGFEKKAERNINIRFI